MGSVIENEKTKEKCQIFTPDDIVKSMLDHLGYSDHLYGKTILESSCGNGQFLDNGVGMTKETIETCWMLIGTDNKRVEYLSTKKRIKSGEKGIGRFALDPFRISK